MYRNILIATDGSALAEHAVSHGLSLAKSLGAKVTALIVEAPFNVFNVPESRIRQMSEAYAQHAEETKKHATRISRLARRFSAMSGHLASDQERWRGVNFPYREALACYYFEY